VTTSPPAPSSRGRLAAPLAAFLLGALLYANTASNAFVFDDINIVEKNPIARDPSALGTIFSTHYWAGVQPLGNLYRPLTILSFAANHALTGAGPSGYHVTNAILHGAVSALVVLLALGLGSGTSCALAAGLIFASHPIHVEAVAPVVGRSELLAALFGILAWLCHLAATRPQVPRARRAVLITACALLLLAALLSKEHAAVLPSLILAGDLVLRRARGNRAPIAASLAAQGAVLAIGLALRAAIVPGLPPQDPMGSVFGGVDAMTRWLTAIGVLGRYLWLMVFPVHLSADYSFEQIPLIHTAMDPLFLASAAAYAGLAAAGFYLGFRGRRSGIFLLVYLGALFPVSNLPFSIGAVMGERLLYLPSIGLCLLVPALYEELRPRIFSRLAPGPARAVVLAVCLLFSARTILRNGDWVDQLTLFRVTVRTSPRSAKAHYNLGVAEDERGDVAAAMEAYRRAIEIKPDQAQPRRNYGLDLLQEKRPAEALEYLRSAASLDPSIPDVFSDVGIALHQLSRAPEAEEAFREEIRRRPESWRSWYNLGSLLLERDRLPEALEALSRAAAINPADPDARAQMGFALAGLGRHGEAMEAFGEAMRIAPGAGDLLVPLARSAAAAGRADVARSAVRQAASLGLAIPPDLKTWAP